MLTALNLCVGHAEEPHKVGPITSESASVTMEYSEYHKGIDMVFDTPTTLTAPFDGRVESIESYDDMCYVVITNEEVGDSVAFINVHDSPLYLNEKVKIGDVIGKAGDEPIHVSYYPDELATALIHYPEINVKKPRIAAGLFSWSHSLLS